jgi:hypothetical protein
MYVKIIDLSTTQFPSKVSTIIKAATAMRVVYCNHGKESGEILNAIMLPKIYHGSKACDGVSWHISIPYYCSAVYRTTNSVATCHWITEV